ncbi:unnamed protein product [Brassica oleracea var. botrytis]|uniref:Uncharacterized protein n=3 Tax=Brassica TaxID=3705 RepID=A0A8X7RRA3_BRACI|nr:hypothetical protein Bca52824_039519 [Brassica carinata]CAF1708541.1 unnamed protein product [Brassica napus]CDY56900.1 BnaCnng31350D [Brassica napus]VDC96702.1 unnamed protein product [Brassica oleracea]
MDSLGVIADEEVNTDADVKVGMDADVADDNVIKKEFICPSVSSSVSVVVQQKWRFCLP